LGKETKAFLREIGWSFEVLRFVLKRTGDPDVLWEWLPPSPSLLTKEQINELLTVLQQSTERISDYEAFFAHLGVSDLISLLPRRVVQERAAWSIYFFEKFPKTLSSMQILSDMLQSSRDPMRLARWLLTEGGLSKHDLLRAFPRDLGRGLFGDSRSSPSPCPDALLAVLFECLQGNERSLRTEHLSMQAASLLEASRHLTLGVYEFFRQLGVRPFTYNMLGAACCTGDIALLDALLLDTPLHCTWRWEDWLQAIPYPSVHPAKIGAFLRAVERMAAMEAAPPFACLDDAKRRPLYYSREVYTSLLEKGIIEPIGKGNILEIFGSKEMRRVTDQHFWLLCTQHGRDKDMKRVVHQEEITPLPHHRFPPWFQCTS
jgi:hypothetical protein